MSKELSQFDQLRADITLFVAPVAQLVVTDFESGQKALEASKTITSYINKLDAKRKELKAPIIAQGKLIESYHDDIAAPLLAAKKFIGDQLLAWERGQEQIRQEKMRKEEALRRENEAKAAAEIARVQAEMNAKRQAEMAELNSKAEMDDLFGTDDVNVDIARAEAEARQAREQAEMDARVEREAKIRESEAKARQWDIEATRLKGTKKVWKCEALDLAKVPREFLIITLNEAACKAAARGGTVEIPGVRLWQESELAIGATTSLKSPAQLLDPTGFAAYDKTKI